MHISIISAYCFTICVKSWKNKIFYPKYNYLSSEYVKLIRAADCKLAVCVSLILRIVPEVQV